MSDFNKFIIKNRVKKGTWHKKENHILYANYLGKILQYNKIDDWYKINSKLINENYGSGLIKFYEGSPIMFLKEVFPEYNWLEWKFSQTTQGFWNKLENQILYAKYLSDTLNYTKIEDFYNITTQIITNNYGGGLLQKNNGSPFQFLKKVFPEYNWLGWRFHTTPYDFWNSDTEKQYAIWLGEKCGYKNMNDWYKISRKILIDNHGGGYILKKYKWSPSLFIKTVFPEHNWLGWKFLVTPNNFWNLDTAIQYANWLGETLGYKNMNDWYNVSVLDFKQNYGYSILINRYRGSPFLFLKKIFPKEKWKKYKFSKKYSNGQIQWLEFIKISTPDIQHYKNTYDGEFKIPKSNYSADGYSLKENCVYEYHGDFWHGNPSLYNSDDINKCANETFGNLYNKTIKKQQFCEKNGYKFKFIWESEWLNGIKLLVKIQKKYKILFNQNLNK